MVEGVKKADVSGDVMAPMERRIDLLKEDMMSCFVAVGRIDFLDFYGDG